MLGLAPDNAGACCQLGAAVRDQGRLEESLGCYQRAIELRPAYPEAHNDMGNVLRDLGRFAEAEASYRLALKARPDMPETHYYLGNILRALGRLTESAASYRRALELRPVFREAHSNLAMLLLSTGDYRHGWEEYEWRWQFDGYGLPAHRQPLWDGSPLQGRTILLHPEQGFGDTIQFARYAPLVKRRGGTVLLHCPRQLLGLLGTCPGVDQLVPLDAPPPAFDVYAPLLSLPRLFGTTVETIPASVPYLAADAKAVERWRALTDVPGFKVGIVWQGSNQHAKDRRRSIPLKEFAPLARIAGVQLFSLQVGSGQEQLTSLAGSGDPRQAPLTSLAGSGVPRQRRRSG